MKHHLQEIEHVCRRLNQQHLLLALGLAAIDAALGVGLLVLWEALFFPLQESTLFWIIATGCLVWFCGWIWIYRHHAPEFRLNPTRLSRRIESAHPQLNDLLVTAADLDRRHEDAETPLARHVLAEARDQLNHLEWKRSCLRACERAVTVACVLLFGALSLILASLSQPIEKAVSHAGTQLGLVDPGIRFGDLPEAIALDADWTVDFRITRHQQAASIEWSTGGQAFEEQAVVDQSGEGAFTFYAVQSPIRFRVTTPSLRSPWIEVGVFEPARLEAAQLSITPPPYTGLPASEAEGLRDLEVPEGSRIGIQLMTSGAKAATLSLNEAVQPMDATAPDTFTATFTATGSGTYTPALGDARGRTQPLGSYAITVIPDRPPTVEILNPTRDTVLLPDQIVIADIFAADDYGLASGTLHLRLSNGAVQELNLPMRATPGMHDLPSLAEEKPLRRAEIKTGIDLTSLDAGDGEFLTLFAEVVDTRKPQPNRTRSDLLFVEIREPIPPVERDGMPMEQREIDFRALIEEQKRLLRETYRILDLPQAETVLARQEIAGSLGALSVEIGKIETEIRPFLVGEQGAALLQLFDDATSATAEAIRILHSGISEDAIPPQNQTLRSLLRLENAFRQNMRSDRPMEENSSQGQGQGQSEAQKKQDQQQQVNLEKAARDLNEIIRAQNTLNRDYNRASAGSWAEAEANRASSQQNLNVDRARDVNRLLQRLPETQRLRAFIGEARDLMEAASASADALEAGAAFRSGLRSREALRQAATELQGLLADQLGRELEAAAQQASALAKAQAEAAEASAAAASGSPSAGEMEAMEASQRNLGRQLDDLTQRLAERAGALREEAPEVSKAMQQALQANRDARTPQTMERAANALLYGQPGRAQPLQSSAASQLAEMAGQLAGAREQLASSPLNRARALQRALHGTLEELASYARDPETTPAERLEEVRRDWQARFDELQGITRNPGFGNLAGQMGRSEAGSAETPLNATRSILGRGSQMLQQFLFDAGSMSELEINREAVPPPDRYRSMVEDYFMRLADEPEEGP